MILVVNSMIHDRLAESFNRALLRVAGSLGRSFEFKRIQRLERPPDLSRYSHIILSGSEASAMDDQPWNPLLSGVIAEAAAREKPLLGICYGHQFVAKVLAGVERVRKSPTPEFGFVSVQLAGNPLFAGVRSPAVRMVSHYDEVTGLPGDFTVIASSSRCAVHGFQYKNLPLWGVQFHPEYNREDAEEIFRLAEADDSEFRTRILDELTEENQLESNRLIFRNFLNI